MATRRAIKNAKKLAGEEDDPKENVEESVEEVEKEDKLDEKTIRMALEGVFDDDVEENRNTKERVETPVIGLSPSKVIHGHRDDLNDSVLSVKIPKNLLEALEVFLVDTKKAKLSNGIKHNGFKTTYVARLLVKELVNYGYYVEDN